MKWAVLILFFAALFADIYIYRSVVSAAFRRLPARIGYIIFALLTDGMGLSVFLLYGYAAQRGSAAIITVMWLVWVFMLTAFPKIYFALGSFLDWLISLFTRKRIHVFRWLGIMFSAVVMAAMIYGATTGRTKFRVCEVTVTSPRLPEGFDGYRIAQFSDVHLGTMNRPAERMAEMAEIINSLDADLVVNTGDLINISYRDLTPEVAAELGRISARDGVVSVYGNHDLGFYIQDSLSLPPAENVARLKDRFDGMGWRTLCDETMYIFRGSDSVAVSGLNFPPDSRLSGHNAHLSGVDLEKTFAGVPRDAYSIVLSHAPQMWHDIVDTGHGDLTLAGHVHSMQVKVSLFGREWSPARLIYREWSGLYEKNVNKYLYINDGIGCVGYPMRVGTLPEITLITLRKCE